MKNSIVAVCVSAALAAGGPAFAKTADAPLKITASGEGRVQCTLADARGNILRSDLKPGNGKQKEYSNADVEHGSCEYRAAKSELAIAVVGDAWACPLHPASADACRQTIPAGVSGSFRVVRKD